MSLLTANQGLRGLTLSMISEWATIFTLIFGGCCSNALTLEQLTRAHPQAGSLITFAQFILISAHGLPTFLTSFRWHGIPLIKLKKRRIPLAPYLIQVALFYAISILNNMAFAYNIPMPVHIIFRSGGLVVSMIMGWAFAGKSFTMVQVASVFLVTLGVALTTLSASGTKARISSNTTADTSTSQYAIGIAILSLALVLAGALGLAQDWTYVRYTNSRSEPPSANGVTHQKSNGVVVHPDKACANGSPKIFPSTPTSSEIQPWQESMFYLHFLSLPMFLFVRQDLVTQFRALHSSPPLRLFIPLETSLMPTLYPPFGLSQQLSLPKALDARIPSGYIPLALTTLTSLVCVAGVNRLTARVSSLTVTLVLVVRKAVSMVISVVLFGAKTGPGKSAAYNADMMWAGAALVFLGTMGYAAGTRKSNTQVQKVKKD
ncbi:UAA transporter [Daedaleopsis nitida]|nr:UAA transporter [Daedaleopsis nitida]